MDVWKKPKTNEIQYGSMRCAGKSAFVYCFEILSVQTTIQLLCVSWHINVSVTKRNRPDGFNIRPKRLNDVQRQSHTMLYRKSMPNLSKWNAKIRTIYGHTNQSWWAQSAIRCKLCGAAATEHSFDIHIHVAYLLRGGRRWLCNVLFCTPYIAI